MRSTCSTVQYVRRKKRRMKKVTERSAVAVENSKMRYKKTDAWEYLYGKACKRRVRERDAGMHEMSA